MYADVHFNLMLLVSVAYCLFSTYTWLLATTVPLELNVSLWTLSTPCSLRKALPSLIRSTVFGVVLRMYVENGIAVFVLLARHDSFMLLLYDLFYYFLCTSNSISPPIIFASSTPSEHWNVVL